MDTKFNEKANPFNRAISTNFNLSLRTFLYYDFLKRKGYSWRLGMGLMHHSNGHARLPNQGLNSVLASFSSQIRKKKERPEAVEKKGQNKTNQAYIATRMGIG